MQIAPICEAEKNSDLKVQQSAGPFHAGSQPRDERQNVETVRVGAPQPALNGGTAWLGSGEGAEQFCFINIAGTDPTHSPDKTSHSLHNPLSGRRIQRALTANVNP